jgi:hypothetical protein
VTAAIALGNPSPRLAGTRQGCATPRPAAAPLTEPAQPRRKHLYEGDARLALVHCEAPTTNILVDELWGQVSNILKRNANSTIERWRRGVVLGV